MINLGSELLAALFRKPTEQELRRWRREKILMGIAMCLVAIIPIALGIAIGYWLGASR